MARVNTNNTSLRFAIESSVGVLPGSPLWRIAEFNTIGAYGAQITSTPRRPISQDRGRKKGSVTDLDSSVEFETDLTLDAFTDFAEGFVFSEFANVEFDLKSGTNTLPPPVATTATYTIDAASATLAGKIQFSAAQFATLVYAKGYTNPENNGLKPVAADTAAAGTAITVAAASLVVEVPPTNASLQVAGVRVLNDADLTLTVTGSTATLVSAAAITNWGSFGIKKGMFIHIGSATAAGAVQNGLGTDGTESYGYARVTADSSNGTLLLDKLSSTLISAAGAATFSQDIMFGRFLRNVPVTADTTDNRYLERTYQAEVSYPDLGGVGVDEYEYAIGNFVNEISINLPLTDKATVNFGFIGTNSDDVTPTRKTGASTAISPLRTTAFNTSSDFASLTTDVVSSASEVCFKSLTLTINNNVSPEKCLGTLGARFVNSGVFEVNLEGQMLFTNKAIVNAIKNNTTITFLALIHNEDGAIAFDIPELTLGDGGREFPVDQSVLVNISGASFTSSSYGYDIGISVFPFVPWAA
jgi:hypothetical protein